jgi:hypothetical protein
MCAVPETQVLPVVVPVVVQPERSVSNVPLVIKLAFAVWTPPDNNRPSATDANSRF